MSVIVCVPCFIDDDDSIALLIADLATYNTYKKNSKIAKATTTIKTTAVEHMNKKKREREREESGMLLLQDAKVAEKCRQVKRACCSGQTARFQVFRTLCKYRNTYTHTHTYACTHHTLYFIYVSYLVINLILRE